MSIAPNAPWLHLLNFVQKGWREKQFAKGRNPDSYIEEQLRKSGDWPVKLGKPQKPGKHRRRLKG